MALLFQKPYDTFHQLPLTGGRRAKDIVNRTPADIVIDDIVRPRGEIRIQPVEDESIIDFSKKKAKSGFRRFVDSAGEQLNKHVLPLVLDRLIGAITSRITGQANPKQAPPLPPKSKVVAKKGGAILALAFKKHGRNVPAKKFTQVIMRGGPVASNLRRLY